jgi:hypothetical protein
MGYRSGDRGMCGEGQKSNEAERTSPASLSEDWCAMRELRLLHRFSLI